MKLTAKRLLVLRAFNQLEISRKNAGKWSQAVTARDIQKKVNQENDQRWIISASSVQTYLQDLETLGLVEHDVGFAGSWSVTDDGRSALGDAGKGA